MAILEKGRPGKSSHCPPGAGLQDQGHEEGMCDSTVTADRLPMGEWGELWVPCSSQNRLCPVDQLLRCWESQHPYLLTPLTKSFLPLSGAQRASGRGDLKTPGGLSAATGDAGRTGLSWTATEVGPARRQPGGVQRSCPWAWWGSMQKHSLCSTCWTCEHLSLSLSHLLEEIYASPGRIAQPSCGKG